MKRKAVCLNGSCEGGWFLCIPPCTLRTLVSTLCLYSSVQGMLSLAMNRAYLPHTKLLTPPLTPTPTKSSSGQFAPPQTPQPPTSGLSLFARPPHHPHPSVTAPEGLFEEALGLCDGGGFLLGQEHVRCGTPEGQRRGETEAGRDRGWVGQRRGGDRGGEVRRTESRAVRYCWALSAQ